MNGRVLEEIQMQRKNFKSREQKYRAVDVEEELQKQRKYSSSNKSIPEAVGKKIQKQKKDI